MTKYLILRIMNASHLNNLKYKEAVDKFLDFVTTCERQYIVEKGLPMTWYRGQSKDWPLLPSLMRQDVISSCHSYTSKCNALSEKESTLLVNFKREGSIMVDRPLTNKEWYYLARHNGLPSRLLDWTTNSLIALWMAVHTDEADDGYLYAINANDYSDKGKREIRRIEQEYYDALFDNIYSSAHLSKDWNGDVLAVYPDSYNIRQGAQFSRFTLHMPDFNSTLDSKTGKDVFYPAKSKIKPEATLKIEAKEKPFLRTFLTITGLCRWHVYPDLENLAKGLKEELC